MWKHACAFTKWVPSNQFMYANLDYNPDTMTLERFGFIGMDRRCFWGSIGLLWKRPLPVEQILPNITNTVNAHPPLPPHPPINKEEAPPAPPSMPPQPTPEEKKKESLAILERFRTKLTATG